MFHTKTRIHQLENRVQTDNIVNFCEVDLLRTASDKAVACLLSHGCGLTVKLGSARISQRRKELGQQAKRNRITFFGCGEPPSPPSFVIIVKTAREIARTISTPLFDLLQFTLRCLVGICVRNGSCCKISFPSHPVRCVVRPAHASWPGHDTTLTRGHTRRPLHRSQP